MYIYYYYTITSDVPIDRYPQYRPILKYWYRIGTFKLADTDTKVVYNEVLD